MKKYNVKGFTLIELIVVMAIFSIIMFGAMSLLMPSQKIMTNADNMENGQVTVNNVEKYLELELSAAEYLRVYNQVIADPTADVASFVGAYYSGIIKEKTAPDADPSGDIYGKGIVHALTIDNSNGGRVIRHDYEVSFNPADMNVTEIATVDAVNKAYYDSYDLQIMPGSWGSTTEFDKAKDKYRVALDSHDITKISDFLEVTAGLSPTNMTFTIKATTKRICPNGHVTVQQFENDLCDTCSSALRTKGYAFVSTATMPLVNITNRKSAGVSDLYYVIGERTVPDDSPGAPAGATKTEKYIFDRAEAKPPVAPQILQGVDLVKDGDGEGFTFIYSFGIEQNTKST